MTNATESNGKVLRWNVLEGEYVIFSPARADRPWAAETEDPHRDALGPRRCPFCPGHEAEVPPIRFEAASRSAHRPWATRVFRNKYPALDELTPDGRPSHGSMILPGHGLHEVIVESAIHDEDMHEMSVESLKVVLETYRARLGHLYSLEPPLYPVLFKNHGRRAGASLRHPHSQLIGVPSPPARSLRLAQQLSEHFESRGRCLMCAMIDVETEDGDRIIWEDDQAFAFVPFAAQVPYEIIIAPRTHSPDLTRASGELLSSVAEALGRSAFALHQVLGSIAYNVVVELPSPFVRESGASHWWIRIVPRIGVEAGFELGSGMRINTAWPETCAGLMRETLTNTRAA